jgi:outer membrane protein assembly factor BamB
MPFTSASRSGDFSGKGGFNGSWSTPVVVEVDGHEELIVVESTRIVGHDPKTGESLWTCDGLPPQVFATPTIQDGIIVAMEHAVPAGTKMVAIKLGGQGDVSESHELWEMTLRKDCISSGVIHNGHLFLIQEMGIGLCLDATSGEKKWEMRLRGKGGNGGVWASIVRVDDALLVANPSGDVFVIDASPEFQVQQRNRIGNETMCASPAVTTGKSFLRTYDALWCIGTEDNAE